MKNLNSYQQIMLCFFFITSCNHSNQLKEEISVTKKISSYINNSNKFKQIDSANYVSIFNIVNKINRKIPKYSQYEKFYACPAIVANEYSTILIMHKDESCCRSVYAVNLSNQTKYPIDSKLLTVNGSDGDWTEVNTAEHKDNVLIINKYIRTQQYDNKSNKYTRQIMDHIVINYEFQKDGKIDYNRTDSTRTYKPMYQ